MIACAAHPRLEPVEWPPPVHLEPLYITRLSIAAAGAIGARARMWDMAAQAHWQDVELVIGEGW